MKKSILILIAGLISIYILGTIPATACVATVSPYDYGDAPDPLYPTLLANNGARHEISNLYLGAGVDTDDDGLSSALADGDVDDGIGFPNIWVRGLTANIGVTSSGTGSLNAWVDFNGDGDWADAGEQVFTNTALTAGTNPLFFDIPDAAIEGYTYARFRLNTAGNLDYFGSALDGEVEDYRVEITSPVPVPASLVLLGMGLLGFAGLSRKKMTHLK